MLYMFQAVPPPIIRISKLYKQHRVFVELFMLLTAIMGELGLIYVCFAHANSMLCVQF